MENYLAEYLGGIPDESMTPYCENHAVDAVARHYLMQAAGAGVSIDVRLQIPQDAGLPDSDLCIIFGNIIENAVISCLQQDGGKKFIRARCEVMGGRLIFTMDNSGNEIDPHGQRGGEGIGLRSVQAVTDKWGGTLEFGCEDGVYKTSVILMIP